MAYDNDISISIRQNSKTRFSKFQMNCDDDEYLLSNSYCKVKYNIQAQNGHIANNCLPSGLIINDREYSYTLASENCKLFHYKKYDFENKTSADKLLIFEGVSLPLKYIDLFSEDTSIKIIENAVFESVPNFINYRLDKKDVVIMTSSTGSMLIWDGENNLDVQNDCPKISSMALSYERIFATDSERRTYLWFSDDLDPRNWSVSLDEAGYIEILDSKGWLNKVVSFLDYVYVFKTYGITRLSAFYEQTQFSLCDIYSSMGKIFQDSVQVCGDKILFLSTDGLYSFDGLATRQINGKIKNMLSRADYTNLASCFCNNKYYVSFRYDFGDSKSIGCESNLQFVNNTTLIFDLENGNIELLRGYDILCFECVSTELGVTLCAVTKTLSGVTLCAMSVGGGLEKYIEFSKYDYANFDRLKLFKNLYINTKYDITIKFTLDYTTHSVSVKGCDGVQKVDIYKACVYFGFAIIGGENIDVSAISFDYEVI